MSKNVWLVVDVSNLCWRAFHTTGKLSHAGVATGVTFGFLKGVRDLMALHSTNRIAFCFDRGVPKRKLVYGNYKKKRHEKPLTDEEKEAYAALKAQMELLRKDYLPRLGFKNVFSSKGYEGDDVIASVVKNLPPGDEAVIVSSDKDMYQLLTDKVCVWHPVKKEAITKKSFMKEWQLAPRWWSHVKAIAGCDSDGVIGIRGVGEKTAAKFIRSEIPEDHKISNTIKANNRLYLDNLALVRLPYEGCPAFKLMKDKVKPKAWKMLTKKLGMKSIVGRVPGMVDGFGLRPQKLREE